MVREIRSKSDIIARKKCIEKVLKKLINDKWVPKKEISVMLIDINIEAKVVIEILRSGKYKKRKYKIELIERNGVDGYSLKMEERHVARLPIKVDICGEIEMVKQSETK